MSALYYANTHSWIFEGLVDCSLKKTVCG